MKEVMNAVGKGIEGAANIFCNKKRCATELAGKIMDESGEALKTIFNQPKRTAEENDMLRIYVNYSELYDKIEDAIFDEKCESSPDYEKIERLYEQAEEIRRDKHSDEDKAADYEREKEYLRQKENRNTILALGSTIALSTVAIYAGLRIIKKII